MHVLGIDPSLTSTGYAWRNDPGSLVCGSLIQKEARGMARLRNISAEILKYKVLSQCSLAIVEGYAFSFAGGASRAHSLGEVGGVIKFQLWAAGVDLLIVPPTSLKMFALGHYKTMRYDAFGGKKKIKVKELVKTAAEKHAGKMFANTDQADAYWLLQMGEAYLDPRLLPRMRRNPQRDALQGSEFIKGKVLL